MSEHDQQEADLGPRPDPEIEPGEPNPGGVDANPDGDGVDGETALDPLAHDLDPDANPAVDDALPEEMKEGEDTSTEATEATEGSDDVAPEEESPA